jgi:hypothetical protein
VHADVQQKHTFGTRTSLTQTPKPKNQEKVFRACTIKNKVIKNMQAGISDFS